MNDLQREAEKVFQSFEENLTNCIQLLNIVKQRGEGMMQMFNGKSIDEVTDIMAQGHFEEYSVRLQDLNYGKEVEEINRFIAYRCGQFGKIYKEFVLLEKKLSELIEKYKIGVNPFTAHLKWDIASAESSYKGAVMIAKKYGWDEDRIDNEIKKLY